MGKPDALTRRQDLQEGSRAAEAPPKTLLNPDQFVIGTMNSDNSDNSDLQSDILDRIRRFQPEDHNLQVLWRYLINPDTPRPPELSKKLEAFSYRENMVHFGNLIYVPNNHQLKIDLLQQVHNAPTAGHLGQAKTYDLLSRHYYFPGARAFVDTYVNGCHTCSRNKVPRHKPYGPLQSLPVPPRPWHTVSMDAIIKLPSSNGYDAIQVFVDLYTKQAHFAPFKEEGFKATDLAVMFRHTVM
jgi:hypothetical protein